MNLSQRPFLIHTDEKEVEAESVIVATGAVAKRMVFKGSGEREAGFWNKGISACAVRYQYLAACDLAICAEFTKQVMRSPSRQCRHDLILNGI